MAYADFAAYKAQYATPQAEFNWYTSNPGLDGSNHVFMSLWSKGSLVQNPMPQGGAVASAPTTAVACDSTTTGAMVRPIAGSGDQLVVSSIIQPYSDFANALVLIDRLSHQGGLSGTVTTTQTTNLPTAALTRYTSGVGVFAGLEFYAAVGSTDAVWTVVYTNQAGTGSRSVSFIIPNTPVINSFIPIPLQGTDTGVKSVESVALTPSTGTAGNFGITLFKPLVWLPSISKSASVRPIDIFNMPGWNTPILDGACLSFLEKAGESANNNLLQTAQIQFGES